MNILGIPEDLQCEETLDLPMLYVFTHNKDIIWEQIRNEILRNKLGLTNIEAACYNINYIAVMVADGKTKNEALQYYNRGSVVYDITAESWDDTYSEEWGVTLAEIKIGQIAGMKYVEYENKEYIIAYVL